MPPICRARTRGNREHERRAIGIMRDLEAGRHDGVQVAARLQIAHDGGREIEAAVRRRRRAVAFDNGLPQRPASTPGLSIGPAERRSVESDEAAPVRRRGPRRTARGIGGTRMSSNRPRLNRWVTVSRTASIESALPTGVSIRSSTCASPVTWPSTSTRRATTGLPEIVGDIGPRAGRRRTSSARSHPAHGNAHQKACLTRTSMA